MMLMFQNEKKKRGGFGGIIPMPPYKPQNSDYDMGDDALGVALYAFKQALSEGDMKTAKKAFKNAVSCCMYAEQADDYEDS